MVLTVVINGTTAGALYNWLNMYPANAFRAELRDRGFLFLAAEVEGIVDTMKKDWFHKPADKKTLRKICPDFSKARMSYGDIKVPSADVPTPENMYTKFKLGDSSDMSGSFSSRNGCI